MKSTLEYYKKNYKQYIDNTINVDMSIHYEFFLKELKGKKILDVGAGSLRDSFYFRSNGFEVECLDPVKEFCDIAIENNFKTYNISILEFDKVGYDAVWACASLLHLNDEELNESIKICLSSLNENGVMYCSFKKGIGTETVDGRFFNYVNEEYLLKLSKELNFNILKTYETNDTLSRDNVWINILFKKSD